MNRLGRCRDHPEAQDEIHQDHPARRSRGYGCHKPQPQHRAGNQGHRQHHAAEIRQAEIAHHAAELPLLPDVAERTQPEQEIDSRRDSQVELIDLLRLIVRRANAQLVAPGGE